MDTKIPGTLDGCFSGAGGSMPILTPISRDAYTYFCTYFISACFGILMNS